ncbi:hypothetical protein RclHR1_07070015 [Rhizophagus clarus]|uniref:Uncharacterized protein n=1 Tax=Rhizophagus clarus TaxID=94130 RepID=A0A2Z6S1C1_9GLOM|nr:hypothetical protein RclHR1_07070015 [Rhizophagus clarus]
MVVFSQPISFPSQSFPIPIQTRTAALAKIHDKWSSQSINQVYSTRKGLSYRTKISATPEGIVYPRWNFFYIKNYNSYQLIYRTQNGFNFTSLPDNLNQPTRTPTKRYLFTKHKTLCDSVRTFNRHITHLSKDVHDKRPHLKQYLPITKPVPVVTDTRITCANQDQIEYILLPEDVRSSMSYGDYMKYKDFFLLKPVFHDKGKRQFALSPGSDNWWQWVKDCYCKHQEELEKVRVQPRFLDWNTSHDRYYHRLDNLNYLMAITDTIHENYEFINFNKTLKQLDRKSKKTPAWRSLEHWHFLTE